MRRKEYLESAMRGDAFKECLKLASGIVANARTQAPKGFDPINSWSTVGTIATIAAAAVSISATAYSAAQGGPKFPNAGSASREVAQAQADALATNRLMASAMQTGGQFSQHIGAHREKQQFVQIPEYDQRFGQQVGPGGQQYQVVPWNPDDWKEGGKYADYAQEHPEFDPAKHVVTHNVKVPEHDQADDFTGYGTADIEGNLARQMADVKERLGAKYGVPFAEEARHEAELADPMGFAARSKELELIQNEIDHPAPINPVAKSLDERMKSRLESGSGLDEMSRNLLDSAVAKANASRGGSTQAGGVEQSMTTGVEGAARRQAGIGEAQSWLTSGATPEDVRYRREEQDLANLGSFIAGQTPESQFKNLSGASQGAAPFNPGQPLPTQPDNASTIGPAYSVAGWQQSLKNQAGQANGWMAGLSSLLSGIGTLSQTK